MALKLLSLLCTLENSAKCIKISFELLSLLEKIELACLRKYLFHKITIE